MPQFRHWTHQHHAPVGALLCLYRLVTSSQDIANSYGSRECAGNSLDMMHIEIETMTQLQFRYGDQVHSVRASDIMAEILEDF
jgi:hypothetical protein